MNVKILRVSNRVLLHKTSGGSTLYNVHARAFVDGYLVTCTEGSGWQCFCGDDDCEHVDTFVVILHPDILCVLEQVT